MAWSHQSLIWAALQKLKKLIAIVLAACAGEGQFLLRRGSTRDPAW